MLCVIRRHYQHVRLTLETGFGHFVDIGFIHADKQHIGDLIVQLICMTVVYYRLSVIGHVDSVWSDDVIIVGEQVELSSDYQNDCNCGEKQNKRKQTAADAGQYLLTLLFAVMMPVYPADGALAVVVMMGFFRRHKDVVHCVVFNAALILLSVYFLTRLTDSFRWV